MHYPKLVWIPVCLSVIACTAGESIDVSKDGIIQVEVADTQFPKAETAAGGTAHRTVVVRNTALPHDEHPRSLNLTVSFAYSAPVDEPDGPALELIGGNRTASLAPLESLSLVVQYRRYDDAYPRKGLLRIESDTQASADQAIEMEFTIVDGVPVANVTPKNVDFGLVARDETAQSPIQVANTGSDTLTVESVLFQGHPDLRLRHDEATFEPGQPIEFDPPLEIPTGAIETFVAAYSPQAPSDVEGQVVFYTNDPSHPSGIRVEIVGNEGQPMIKPNPARLQFGGKLVGKKSSLPLEITSIGGSPATIQEIFLAEGSDPSFELVKVDAPFELPVNGTFTAYVEYVPQVESLIVDGEIVSDTATVVIRSDTFADFIEVPVTGAGVSELGCTPIGVIQEGEQVIPQTNVHLFGDQSFCPSGNVASWKWSVKQPTQSQTFFTPSNGYPNPKIQVNAAGQYDLALECWCEDGAKSVVPWKQSLVVIPEEAIHVELLWSTPNDPDETDQGPEAGADLDLHFALLPYAKTQPDLDGDGELDPWFDQPFDTFWFNAHPNWGSFDPSIDDDPGLDRDDTDGAGPENLNLNIPQKAQYRVGVHYWDDHGYGPSYATMRVYIYGNLVFEISDVKLSDCDMWDVATIDWPSGKVELVQAPGGGYKITPNYKNPWFFQP